MCFFKYPCTRGARANVKNSNNLALPWQVHVGTRWKIIWWHFLSWFLHSSASAQGNDLIPDTDFEVCQRRESMFSWLSANQLGGLGWMNLPQRLSGHNARQPQGDFRAPKLLTHQQFAVSKSHWISSSASGARAPVFRFNGVSSSNPRHAVEIHLHLEASANTGWTRGSGWERGDGGGSRGGGRGIVAGKCCREISASAASEAAEVVIRPFKKWMSWFNSHSKREEARRR